MNWMSPISPFWLLNQMHTIVFINQMHHDELGVTNFHEKMSSEESVECVVCLSKIDEDDEIRELRCDHLFHKGCLDRCVEYKHTTCPLCREIDFLFFVFMKLIWSL